MQHRFTPELYDERRILLSSTEWEESPFGDNILFSSFHKVHMLYLNLVPVISHFLLE